MGFALGVGLTLGGMYDKVDVDTGCPGWGGMSIRVGPRRCGELADIILDEEGVHTAAGRPGYVTLPAGVDGGYESCRAALRERPDRSVIEIGTADLAARGAFCVTTDLGNIAAVRVDEVQIDALGQLEAMTISFTVWAPGVGD